MNGGKGREPEAGINCWKGVVMGCTESSGLYRSTPLATRLSTPNCLAWERNPKEGIGTD